MNRTIKLLILADVFMLTGFGLVEPILAIFINEDVSGGSIAAVGIAGFIFLVTKSFVQIPFARYVDTYDVEELFLLGGTALITLTPLLYLLATHISFIYLAQFLMGLGSGMAYPAWLSIWDAHLDRHRISYQWSLYSTLTGLGTALSAAAGASIAQFFGFRVTFLVVWVASLCGTGILWYLQQHHRRVGKVTRSRRTRHPRQAR